MILRKTGAILVAALILVSGTSALASGPALTDITLAMNGKPTSLGIQVDRSTSRSYASATDLGALLGAQVSPDGAGVKLSNGRRTVEIFPSTNAIVNGLNVPIDDGLMNVGGTQYVPIRFVSAYLGFMVGWDAHSRQVQLAGAVTSQAATYTVTSPGDYFMPRTLSVNVGDTVIFNNTDTDAHTIISVPDAPDQIELALESGKQGSFTFTKPGIYHYYCSLHAGYDADTTMIKAVTTADVFPAAMEGVIVVNGAGFTAGNSVTVTTPGDLFTPYAAVVKAGGTVTFNNTDTDVHTVQTVAGAPEAVTLEIKGGDKATFTFTKPGVYEYYCTVHAAWDDTLKEAKAVKTADIYPESMAGYIIVLP